MVHENNNGDPPLRPSANQSKLQIENIVTTEFLPLFDEEKFSFAAIEDAWAPNLPTLQDLSRLALRDFREHDASEVAASVTRATPIEDAAANPEKHIISRPIEFPPEAEQSPPSSSVRRGPQPHQLELCPSQQC